MTVYLVGAGPGDPGLLTLRGAELIARADVVLYDRLIDRSLLALARPDADLVDVGKRPSGTEGGGAGRQEQINDLLVSHARRGRTVVRLKGGDPFLFGRGGEEAEALRRAGVACEVVPGVSSALAAPAAAGIPVTHRGLSTSVTIVTGHVGDPTAPGGVDWESLARAGGTLVVLMGMATRDVIAGRLLRAGRPPSTPVAVIEWGTTPRQRTVRATLGELARVQAGSPAVIVVGQVAGMDLAGWTERPLVGRTVAVTRARDQAGGLVTELAGAGASVVEMPLIELAAPEDGGHQLAAAAARIAGYDWLTFTSANAVHRFVPLLRDARSLGGVRLAVVGPSTGSALAAYHLLPDLVASPPTAQGLVDAFPRGAGRVLFPRAERARPTLADGLRDKGWTVDDVVAYRTVPAPPPPDGTGRDVRRADAVTFASPSAVAAYRAACDADGRRFAPPKLAVCIGPVTADAARDAGWTSIAVAASPSPSAIVEALVVRWVPESGVAAAPGGSDGVGEHDAT